MFEQELRMTEQLNDVMTIDELAARSDGQCLFLLVTKKNIGDELHSAMTVNPA